MESDTTSSSSGEEEPEMELLQGPQIYRELLRAASCGDSRSMQALASQNPHSARNNYMGEHLPPHILHSWPRGILQRCAPVREVSPLGYQLEQGDTSCHRRCTWPRLVGVFLTRALRSSKDLAGGFRQTILQQDMDGCNALHHAIGSGHRGLALELIAAEPALSHGVNKYNESPMFVAVMRNWADVFEKLLEIPDSAHVGNNSNNAMHAAVRNGNSEIARKIMEKRPGLARAPNMDSNTPMGLAVLWDKIDVLRVLLEHDSSLGYVIDQEGFPLLASAACRGHVNVARELLNHCPDAHYRQADGLTCLHKAVGYGHTEFVKFILTTPQLRNLVNMRDDKGKTALHYAVHKCNPKMVAALLAHKDIDTTLTDNRGEPAAWELYSKKNHAKTLNWNEVCMLMLKADPLDATSIYNLHEGAKENATNASRKGAKSLTQTYTSNTSLVVILMATITFAAAFTLPGGYNSEGLPIMSRKFAFQAFLIFDTLAACASFAVAFICITARWEDYEFLIYYRLQPNTSGINLIGVRTREISCFQKSPRRGKSLNSLVYIFFHFKQCKHA